MTTQERPLITFALFAYNQERFIREAVEGAFSQTYTPLEIILSDDCSADRTFEIMKELVAEYGGHHTIILNRNERNIGIGEHLNRCMELSHGELIVAAAGDDISLPERTAAIYQAWLDSGKKAFSLDSRFEVIDENAYSIKSFPLQDRPQEQQLLLFSKTLTRHVYGYVYGCTHAWHRKVFDVFGPLPSITCEDVLIPVRSMLLGKVISIDKELVKYRTHTDSICQSSARRTIKERTDWRVYILKDHIRICTDIVRCINEHKQTLKDPAQVYILDKCISNIYVCRRRLLLILDILTGSRIIRVYSLLKYMCLYRLQQVDMSIFIWSISRTTYQIGRGMKYFFKACFK
jgi:glycosyltransferase involved in cell wall biosynthesis